MFNTSEFFSNRKGRFGTPLHFHVEAESTNQLAVELARRGAPEGTLIVADAQTRGVGRKGSEWFSPPEKNIYSSLVLRPDASRLHFLPFLAAYALIRSLSGFHIFGDLKWPNDVLVSEKKIAGIMILTSMEDNHLQYAVLGTGINVNQRQFPNQLENSATSIALHTGTDTSRELLLSSFLFEFENLYERINTMFWDDLLGEIEKHSSYLRDCNVIVEADDQTVEGVTAGLDSFGGLVVNTPAGRRIFYAGQIRACRKK